MDRNSLIAALESPDRAWIVFVVGLILIYREFSAPGRVLPGILGAVGVCLSVYSFSQRTLHTDALLMILGGIVLIMVQVFRGFFWLPGLFGAILIVLGVHRMTYPPIHLLLASLGLPLSGITVFFLRTAVRARRNKVSLQ